MGKFKLVVIFLAMVSLVIGSNIWAEEISVPHSFSSGTTIRSSEMNENFRTVYDKVNELQQTSDTKTIQAEYGETWTASGVMADTWCAFLTGFSAKSHAVKVGSGPGTEIGITGSDICNNVAISAANNCTLNNQWSCDVSSVTCVKGYTRIAPTQKGRHSSFYWTHDCNWGEHDNGPTYVCCTW